MGKKKRDRKRMPDNVILWMVVDQPDGITEISGVDIHGKHVSLELPFILAHAVMHDEEISYEIMEALYSGKPQLIAEMRDDLLEVYGLTMKDWRDGKYKSRRPD